MQRLLPALVIAVTLHCLFLFSRCSLTPVSPPILQGEKRVKIHLRSMTVPEEVAESVMSSEPLPPSQVPEPVIIDAAELSEKRFAGTQKIHPLPLAAHRVKKYPPQKRKTKATVSAQPAKKAAPATPQDVTAWVKATPLTTRNPKPQYPTLARRRNYEGTVILSVLVSHLGAVDQVTIHSSSGHRILDSTAQKTVSSWHFHPGMKAGKAVAMEVLVPVQFTLQ